MRIIILVPQQTDFIEKCGTHVITENGENWFYLPHWYKKEDTNVFTEVNFENLPQYVKDIIIKNRES